MGVSERKALQAEALKQGQARGHGFTKWKDTRSNEGKFVTFCQRCGDGLIVYINAPVFGNTKQISGSALERECPHGA